MTSCAISWKKLAPAIALIIVCTTSAMGPAEPVADELSPVHALSYGCVEAMAYSPDGEMVAVVMGEGIEFRDAETLQLLMTTTLDCLSLRSPCVCQTEIRMNTALRALSFSEDGSLLYLAGVLVMGVYRSDDGEFLGPLPATEGLASFSQPWAVSSMGFSHDGSAAYIGTTHGRILTRDMKTGRTVASSLTHAEGHAVTALAASSDGRRLASAGADYTVALWDLSGVEEPKRWAFQDEPKALAFSTDKDTLRIVCANGTLHEASVALGTLEDSLHLSVGRIAQAAFGESGHALALVNDEGLTYGWSDGEDGSVLRLPFESPSFIVVHPSKPTVCAMEETQDAQTLQIVSLENGSLSALHVYPPGLPAVAFAASGNGDRLAIGDPCGSVRLFDTASWERVGEAFSLGDTDRRWCTRLSSMCSEVRGLRFTPDGQTLVIAGPMDIVAWDIAAGAWSAYAGGGADPTLSPNAAWSAWFTRDAVEIHANDLHEAHTVVPYRGSPWDDSYGMRVLFTSDSRAAILLCNGAAGLVHFLEHEDPIYVSVNDDAYTADEPVAAVSPSGNVLAVVDHVHPQGFKPHRILMIDTVSGARLAEIEIPTTEGDRAMIECIAFDSSGSLLLVARRARVEVIAWETGTTLACLDRHRSDITHIKTIPQTSLVATSADDGSLFVWDLASLQGDQ